MRHRTFRYFSAQLISLLLLLSIGSSVVAQTTRPTHVPKREQKSARKEVAPDTIPLLYGAYIGVDLLGVGNKLLGGDFLSSEVSLVANLKNRYLPTLEVGYGSTDAWNETGIRYQSSAPYFRIGMDYNTMWKKQHKNSFLYVGLRYGMSSFNYEISNLPVTDLAFGNSITNPSFQDEIWGNREVPFNHNGLKGSVQWFELVTGINVNIYKNFNMGWNIRLKYKTAASLNEYADPWYVPGFGLYQSRNIGLTYSLIYKLTVRKK